MSLLLLVLPALLFLFSGASGGRDTYGFYNGANPIFGRITQRGGFSARYLRVDT